MSFPNGKKQEKEGKDPNARCMRLRRLATSCADSANLTLSVFFPTPVRKLAENMAEALGIAGGVIAVLQITKSVLSVCSDYKAAVKGAPWELPGIQKETEDLLGVLQRLEPLALKGSASDPRQFANLALLSGPEGLIEVCRNDIARLEKKLKAPDWMKAFGPRRQALVQSLRWPLKEADTKKIIQSIGRFTRVLNLALEADQTYASLLSRESYCHC